MFSEDSLSADEDDRLTLSNNEWTYPLIHRVGRKMKSLRRKNLGNSNNDVMILICTNEATTEDQCGAYDEALAPTEAAFDLMVNDWEVLLRRTTIYLCTWAEGIVEPRVLRKYIDKSNAEWIKLYRYVWFKSQTNYLGVFPSPKTFALATCLDQPADENKRRQVIDQTVLPPGKTKNPMETLAMRSERVIVVSDLPLMWKSRNKVENDIPITIEQWGWTNVQQYSPSDYDPKVNYLEQPCNQVAELLENANQKDDIRGATIHVWIAMTDIIDYKAKGGSVHFAMKNPCEPLNTYFMQCLQRLHDAGRGKNPVIVNVNASGEFLSCNDTTKFKKVTRTIVNELRSEGYMVSWGGPMWREVHTFLDAHGKISGKGLTEKHIAVGIMEKQLYREKTLMRCMFAPKTITDLELLATLSGIAKIEGLVDEPPQEYNYEDVNAVPFGINSQQSGSGRGRKVKPKMHVPHWDGQPKTSYQPTPVSDERFFWITIDHGSRDEMKEDDPMMHLSGLCDYCSVSQLDNLTTEDARTARQITHSTRLEDILKRRIGN